MENTRVNHELMKKVLRTIYNKDSNENIILLDGKKPKDVNPKDIAVKDNSDKFRMYKKTPGPAHGITDVENIISTDAVVGEIQQAVNAVKEGTVVDLSSLTNLNALLSTEETLKFEEVDLASKLDVVRLSTYLFKVLGNSVQQKEEIEKMIKEYITSNGLSGGA